MCTVAYHAHITIAHTASYGALWDRIAIRKITGEHNTAVRVQTTLQKIMMCRTNNHGCALLHSMRISLLPTQLAMVLTYGIG
ncbi:hypothetical protein P029_02015 [Anaplasma phagocytophilum str. Norway variant2]|uniref:Uncharacterized protein n=1 Tax=Anaplasma phagocytophilum str. Norway variant2 TaxID=1392507 RepID=A0A161IQK3_ANAPH|nr:hypothetical protein P029_02015 [Anaplasma phagocytophilum str. Norway variant2]